MGNKLFQQAHKFVDEALHGHHSSKSDEEMMETAQNALSSAFANSTDAEREQLSELQADLESSKYRKK